jgi:hypothetical protein
MVYSSQFRRFVSAHHQNDPEVTTMFNKSFALAILAVTLLVGCSNRDASSPGAVTAQGGAGGQGGEGGTGISTGDGNNVSDTSSAVSGATSGATSNSSVGNTAVNNTANTSSDGVFMVIMTIVNERAVSQTSNRTNLTTCQHAQLQLAGNTKMNTGRFDDSYIARRVDCIPIK